MMVPDESVGVGVDGRVTPGRGGIVGIDMLGHWIGVGPKAKVGTGNLDDDTMVYCLAKEVGGGDQCAGTVNLLANVRFRLRSLGV